MNRIPIWVFFFSFFLLLHMTTSVEDEVKTSLINFLEKLSNNSSQSGLLSSWNPSSDPCINSWPGVICDSLNTSIRKLFLNSSNLAGELDITFLCGVEPLAASLTVVHLELNDINGEISTEISSCKKLTRFHLSGNKLSGSLPDSLAMLNNFKILDVSNNFFFGAMPDLSGISGLTVFLAQNNDLSGEIPRLDFSNLKLFNVSYNKLTGRIPDVHGHFDASSFIGNPGLCGDPLPKECPPSQADNIVGNSNESSSKRPYIMFVGYFVLGVVFVLIIIIILYKRNKRKKDKPSALPHKVAAVVNDYDESMYESSTAASMEYKASDISRSDISAVSAEQSALVSSSLVVLTSPEVNGLKFEDLLQAPAEMLGRGNNGSLYKVMLENEKDLVVKRIKYWAIASHEFKQRMQRLDQVKHPNVLPALAFYSSKQEKLLLYEYQQNGNLFKFLHGTNIAQAFDWASRLGAAATIAEALAFMHQELQQDGIAHGNLKSSNILLNKNMEPCISEYGLMEINSASKKSSLPAKIARAAGSSNAFKDDVYGYGVILLELLTGNLVQHNGVDLTDWVQSVVREEWTVEVFDKSLISECASEESLVNLLRIAIKCVNNSPQDRPTMNQVAVMINTIREEEERSTLAYEP